MCASVKCMHVWNRQQRRLAAPRRNPPPVHPPEIFFPKKRRDVFDLASITSATCTDCNNYEYISMDFFVLQDAERSERFLTTSRGLESVAAARHPSRSSLFRPPDRRGVDYCANKLETAVMSERAARHLITTLVRG
jgi:hypothetical protein